MHLIIDSSEILSVSEAARLIGISDKTTRRAADCGWLPSGRAESSDGRGARLFNREDVIAYRDRRIAALRDTLVKREALA